jgi:hypothetical protein
MYDMIIYGLVEEVPEMQHGRMEQYCSNSEKTEWVKAHQTEIWVSRSMGICTPNLPSIDMHIH